MTAQTPLIDRFDLLIGAGVGVAAWVFGIPLVICILAALAVVGVNATTGALRRERAAAPAPLPAPPVAGSPEARLLERGNAAAAAFGEIAASLPAEVLAERSTDVRRQARLALAMLTDLGRQSATVANLLERLGAGGFREERELIRRRLAKADSRQRIDLGQSLAALETRAEARRNLLDAQSRLRLRMETVTYGMEGLVARLAELAALADSGSLTVDADRIDQLTLELEGLRQGLIQTDHLGRMTAGFAMEEEI